MNRLLHVYHVHGLFLQGRSQPGRAHPRTEDLKLATKSSAQQRNDLIGPDSSDPLAGWVVVIFLSAFFLRSFSSQDSSINSAVDLAGTITVDLTSCC
jgi:hypothetical protein